MRKFVKLSAAAILGFGLNASLAKASIYVYWGTNQNTTDPTSNDWETAGVWTLDGVHAAPGYPGAGDTAVIGGGVVTNSETTTVAIISLQDAGGTTFATIKNTGSLTVSTEMIAASTTGGGKFRQMGDTATATIAEFVADSELDLAARGFSPSSVACA